MNSKPLLLNKSSIRLFIGFTLIIFFILLLLLHISKKMEIAHQQLDIVVQNYFKKTMLIAQMQSSAKDRRIYLQEILLQKDPFIREESWELFIDSANIFLKAFRNLENMALSPQEKKLLEKQRIFIQQSSPVLNKVIHLARNNLTKAAHDLFVKNAISLKKGHFLAFSEMGRLQKESADNLTKQANNSYSATQTRLWILGGIFMLLGLLIALYVTSRTIKMTQVLNQARTIAEESNEAKSRFIANMSHELRTPLNAILGYSDILLETTEDIIDSELRDEIYHDLKSINGAGNRLLVLVTDVLDLSRLETGKMQLDNGEFDIKQLCIEIQKTFIQKTKKNNNTLSFKYVKPLSLVYADQAKIRQIVINLLSNATKFTKNGQIYLHLLSDHDKLLIKVTDTGIGIGSTQQAKIFDAFSQADLSSTRAYEGSGLGLAISQRFAHMMGGEITLDSKQPEGSTFIFYLPQYIKN